MFGDFTKSSWFGFGKVRETPPRFVKTRCSRFVKWGGVPYSPSQLGPPDRISMSDEEEAMVELTGHEGGFVKWLASAEGATVIDSWHDILLDSVSSPEAFEASCRTHFGSYKPPADCSGWLLSLAMMAETLPIALSVSDAGIAGLPLVYVNPKFCEMTGYTRQESTGRNCRFLQGPETHVAHGQHLLANLRDGKTSQTTLLNYRKSGEQFEQVLTLAYVFDSIGRRRFCVGLGVDTTGLESDPGPFGRDRLASGMGSSVLKEALHKTIKLVKMLPQHIPVPEPPPREFIVPGYEWSCPQLEDLSMALDVGIPPTAETNWISLFTALLEHAPHAVCVVDMSIGMLPLTYVNPAFTMLTGYSAEESIGRNCRFLQGSELEKDSLMTIIQGIRDHRPVDVCITNLRKDGSQFQNALTLHPIFDSDGICRYYAGVLSEVGAPAPEGVDIEFLREKIPSQFDANLQPMMQSYDVVPVDSLAQWKEFQPSISKMVQLLWSVDCDGALRRLFTIPEALAARALGSFGRYLAIKRPDDEARLLQLISALDEGRWRPFLGRVDQADMEPSVSSPSGLHSSMRRGI
ncbi:MAG: hypothetical protein SGPRY_002937 [Prymnesium sp.]